MRQTGAWRRTTGGGSGRGGVVGVTGVVGVAAVACVAAALGGCLGGGYTTWPPVEPVREGGGGGESAEFSAVNTQPTQSIVGDALRWVSLSYPPQAERAVAGRVRLPFAINVPRGATEETYRLIARRVGPDCSPLSRQFTPDLPVYHVASVSVRGAYAEVIILRPIIGLSGSAGGSAAGGGSGGGGGGGPPLYQPVRLDMKGGLSAWTVIGHQTYPIGMMPVPPLNYVEDGRPVPAPGGVRPGDIPASEPAGTPTSGD